MVLWNEFSTCLGSAFPETKKRGQKAALRNEPAGRHGDDSPNRLGTLGCLPKYPALWERTPEPIQSEKAERVDVVADQQVLGLLIVVEHHLVGLAAHT